MTEYPALPAMGLVQLLEAFDSAQELACSPWEFALPLESLRSAGLSETDLRRLIQRGRVEHGVERTGPASRHRTFSHPKSLRFDPTSCFILKPAGAAWARRVVPRPAIATGVRGKVAGFMRGPSVDLPTTPQWDKLHRVLWWGNVPLIRFRRPAPDLEAILTVFQRAGWGELMIEPLPAKNGGNRKRRLHDAIKRLNRAQHPHYVMFRGDGTGLGVRWEPWSDEDRE